MTDQERQEIEDLIQKVLDSIQNKPMIPTDIASAIHEPSDDVDYAIQLIIERGYAAPNLEWQLAPNPSMLPDLN